MKTRASRGVLQKLDEKQLASVERMDEKRLVDPLEVPFPSRFLHEEGLREPGSSQNELVKASKQAF